MRIIPPQSVVEDLTFVAAFIASYIILEILVALFSGGNRRG